MAEEEVVVDEVVLVVVEEVVVDVVVLAVVAEVAAVASVDEVVAVVAEVVVAVEVVVVVDHPEDLEVSKVVRKLSSNPTVMQEFSLLVVKKTHLSQKT